MVIPAVKRCASMDAVWQSTPVSRSRKGGLHATEYRRSDRARIEEAVLDAGGEEARHAIEVGPLELAVLPDDDLPTEVLEGDGKAGPHGFQVVVCARRLEQVDPREVPVAPSIWRTSRPVPFHTKRNPREPRRKRRPKRPRAWKWRLARPGQDLDRPASSPSINGTGHPRGSAPPSFLMSYVLFSNTCTPYPCFSCATSARYAGGRRRSSEKGDYIAMVE